MTAPRSVGEQAVAVLRVAVGAALDARTPPVPLFLDNHDADTEGLTQWVEEEAVGGTNTAAEVGPPSTAIARERREVVQYLLRAPKGVGYFALRQIAESIEAAVTDVPLVLDDGVTPILVQSVMIGAKRPVDEFGRVAMPVVVFYEVTAPRSVS